MIAWMLHRVGEWRSVVRSGEANEALAWGIALGMVLGMVPKENLLAIGLGMLVLATRASWAAAGMAALVVSIFTPWLDPMADWLGQRLLTTGWLTPIWSQLYDLPFAPWTRFNNTVVLGSFVWGLIWLGPTYLVCSRCLQRWWPLSSEEKLVA